MSYYLLSELGKARDCSKNSVVIKSVKKCSFSSTSQFEKKKKKEFSLVQRIGILNIYFGFDDI